MDLKLSRQQRTLQAQMGTRQPVTRWVGSEHEVGYDELAVEEPLQIRMAGENVAVTMRTPGHDSELALGFLLTEGIISGLADIESVSHCADGNGAPAPNIINVLPHDRNLLAPGEWGRSFISSSSCGLCGKTSIEQIARKSGARSLVSEIRIPVDALYSLESKLRREQETFASTGGLHAAGLFDLGGKLVVAREDVGRHNAVDKVIGHALIEEMLPLDRYILLVSSRASFEIVQKSVIAGLGVLAVVSAPSSLAVELARETGITLVAFLRQGRFNVYSGEERIVT